MHTSPGAQIIKSATYEEHFHCWIYGLVHNWNMVYVGREKQEGCFFIAVVLITFTQVLYFTTYLKYLYFT